MCRGYLFHRAARRRRTGYGLFQKTPKYGPNPAARWDGHLRLQEQPRIEPSRSVETSVDQAPARAGVVAPKPLAAAPRKNARRPGRPPMEKTQVTGVLQAPGRGGPRSGRRADPCVVPARVGPFRPASVGAPAVDGAAPVGIARPAALDVMRDGGDVSVNRRICFIRCNFCHFNLPRNSLAVPMLGDRRLSSSPLLE
jgi:hypothetical protein